MDLAPFGRIKQESIVYMGKNYGVFILGDSMKGDFIGMTKYRHADEEFAKAVKDSYSLRRVMVVLGIVAQGGNYGTIHRRIKRLGLDTSHFTGQGYLKGKSHEFKKKADNEYYLPNTFWQSNKIRKRLLKDRKKPHKCEVCSLEIWLDKPIPLELHHIDGDNSNNQLENLQLLCPNCHAQTSNYRGKNKKCQARDSNSHALSDTDS